MSGFAGLSVELRRSDVGRTSVDCQAYHLQAVCFDVHQYAGRAFRSKSDVGVFARLQKRYMEKRKR